MTVRAREQASDKNQAPVLWYVYILEGTDSGGFYIGQTNDLPTRMLEHNLGAGAKTTVGQPWALKWWNHCHSREAAQALEKRLRSALERSPLEIEGIIERFDRLISLIRPEKTLAQLRQEEKDYESEMSRAFHHSTALSFNTGGRPPTSCGYDGPEYYSTQDWSTLHQMERERKALESVGGKAKGKQACQRCLAVAPKETETN